MAGLTTTIIMGVIAAASVAGTTKSIIDSEDAKKQSKEAAAKQETEQNRLLQEAEDKKRADELALDRDKRRAAQRQGQIAGQAANKGGTILTSPLGTLGSGSGGSEKTLLGT